MENINSLFDYDMAIRQECFYKVRELTKNLVINCS